MIKIVAETQCCVRYLSEYVEFNVAAKHVTTKCPICMKLRSKKIRSFGK